eukprot:scpid4995/ scgid35596/ 
MSLPAASMSLRFSKGGKPFCKLARFEMVLTVKCASGKLPPLRRNTAEALANDNTIIQTRERLRRFVKVWIIVHSSAPQLSNTDSVQFHTLSAAPQHSTAPQHSSRVQLHSPAPRTQFSSEPKVQLHSTVAD